MKESIEGQSEPCQSGLVYAFRRKGLDDFCTCDSERYDELLGKPYLFETAIFYTTPQPCPRCAELEQLCDETYVAKGADAYNHACDELERWQAERRAQGKEVGTEGSLCDGMAWLYAKLAALEAENEKLKSELAEAKKDAERLYELLPRIYIDPLHKILRIDGLYLRSFGEESVQEMILRELDAAMKGK